MGKLVAVLGCCCFLVACSPAMKVQPVSDTADAVSTSAEFYRKPVAEPQDVERKVAKSTTVEMHVKDNADASTAIQKKVSEFWGWVKTGVSDRVVAYVPAARADDFVSAIKEIGKVKNIEYSVRDITYSSDDTNAKLDSLQAVRARYIDLLNKTSNVDEILKIEQELARVNSQIAALETSARQNTNESDNVKFTICLEDGSLWKGVKAIISTPVFYVLLAPFVIMALV